MAAFDTLLRGARGLIAVTSVLTLLACGDHQGQQGQDDDDDDTTMGAADGEPCELDEDCANDACVDGVCCDARCDGPCLRCDLTGAAGTCTPIEAGTDPDAECAGDDATCGGTCDGAGACQFAGTDVACDTCTFCSGDGFCNSYAAAGTDPADSCPTCQVCSGGNSCAMVSAGDDPADDCADEGPCGQDGSCDGGGACSLYAADTIETPQTCSATPGQVELADVCDGLGGVTDGGALFCNGAVCNAGDCAGSCADDSGCIGGYYCDDGGACQPQKTTGLSCGRPGECATGFCADDVCCDAACAGDCEVCNDTGSVGTCTQFAAGTDPLAVCGPYFCDGSGACNTTCTDHSDCVGTHWCDGTTCQPKRDLAVGCSDGVQCISGNCADDVCCTTACGGLCESCVLAGSEGSCIPVPPAQDPDGECTGTGTCGGTCNGAYACSFPAAGLDCGTCSACDGSGACEPVAADTDPNDDCGTCTTCDGSGACALQTAGQDLHDDCPDEGPCGLDGLCDGGGACDYYAAGTEFVAQSCSADTVYYADTCDGAGGVTDGGSATCAPFACDGGGDTCGSACVDSSDCVAGYFCDLGDVDGDFVTDECLPQRDDGDTCTGEARDIECSGGECSNGFCCSVIGGTCCGIASDCPPPPDPSCTNPTTCEGEATVPGCSAHICIATIVTDDTACTGVTCGTASCTGLTWTGNGTCSSTASCDGAPIANCDDAEQCTLDSCDPGTGCLNIPVAGGCDDGDACTAPDTCSAGACVGTPIVCDDGNVCTDDLCDPAIGCLFPDNAAPCDDGQSCTTDDSCSGGVCSGTFIDCDDGEFCTGTESCDEALGCVSSGPPCPPENGDVCDGVSSCNETTNTCDTSPPLDCDDANVCTDDFCDPVTGCYWDPVPCTPGFELEILLADDPSLSPNVFAFNDQFTTPGINNSGLVVVHVRDGSNQPVVLTTDELGYSIVADYADFPAVNWPAIPSINDVGEVAFVPVATPGGVRVVRAETDGTFTVIAGYSDAVPGGGTFSNFNGGGTAKTSPDVLDDGTVVFWASFRDSGGITYNGVFAGDSLATLAKLVEGAPGDFYARVDGDGGEYVARQLVTPGDVLHGVLASGEPPVGIPTSLTNLSSGPSLNASGIVAYIGDDSGTRAVYRSDVPTPLADAAGGYSAMINPDVNAGGDVAFEGTRAGAGRGVYLWNGTVVQTVAEAGDPIADGVIETVRFYRGLNDAREVALWARLEDTREVIIRAAPACLGPVCDDGDVCTSADRCDAGLCAGTPIPGCP